MKSGDKYKTGFITLYSQYMYLLMSQNLIDALHTYFQFSDIVFGHLPKIAIILAKPSLIKDHGNWRFSLFINNYMGVAIFLRQSSIFCMSIIFFELVLDLFSLRPIKSLILLISYILLGLPKIIIDSGLW